MTSQPSKDNIAETDAVVGAADHEEKNISYVYVGLNDGMKIEHHKLSYNELVSIFLIIRICVEDMTNYVVWFAPLQGRWRKALLMYLPLKTRS